MLACEHFLIDSQQFCEMETGGGTWSLLRIAARCVLSRRGREEDEVMYEIIRLLTPKTFV